MVLTPNNVFVFNSFGELTYDLFVEIGLNINQDGYVYDTSTGILIRMKDKYIRATYDNTVIYSGKNDIVFDPGKHYGLMMYMLGYYIDKRENDEDEEPLGFISQGMNEDKENYVQSLFVDTRTRGRIESRYYHAGYLCYIDMIFRLSGIDTDLSNFDIVEVGKKK